MKKNSVFVKTFACLFTASLVVGSYVQTSERFEPKKVDFSAFRNASANIQFLSQARAVEVVANHEDVTSGIVKTIEKEVKSKIHTSRIALRPKAQKTILAEAEAVAKNWNEIRPELASVDLTFEEAKLPTLSLDESSSEFEINNKELINLYSFNTEALRYETFSNVVLASYEEVENVNDEVNVAQASTTTNVVEEITPVAVAPAAPIEPVQEKVSEVNTQAESASDIEAAKVATTENPINDDLVVYDYSKEEETKDAPKSNIKKMFDAPISNSVRNVIERELHKAGTVVSTQAPRKTQALLDNDSDIDLEKVMNDADKDPNTVVYDYSKQKQAALLKKETSSASAFTTGLADDVTTQAEFTIKAKEINLSSQKIRPSIGFEFVPDFDRAERMDDQASGEIKLGYSLSGDMNTQTGVVQAQGMIPTRVELNLKNHGMEIPLLNEGSIQKFLQKKGLDIFGNLFMTAIDSSINDVEIDSDYQAKLFFSDKFKVVETQDKASYVLFLGVKNGNMLVRYLLDNKESAQKIVYIGEGEMYFEDPDFIESERELYTFTTRSLLGRKVKELNIDGSDVTVFGTKIGAKKKTLNSYEIKIPAMVDNSRKYLEFKHTGSSLFVGTSNTKEIEIPGQDFIGRVMQAHQLSELGERCMVQINLKKDLRDIKVSGKNRAGEMFSEVAFLDNDGNFSRDNSELAEKVFITGDLEGIFGTRLEYTDGSMEFLKTYCSEGSYLIEQL